jgi:predicted site-specific integrase-resolvase
MAKNLLTPKEVGAMLGVSRRTLSRYEYSGHLHPIKLNQRVIRYAQSDIDEMLLKFSRI